MSKSQYVTGLRAVEQLLATANTDVRRVYAEYQAANPRVTALIAAAHSRGIEVQAANRARLKQISGEVRHQGIVAEVRRSTVFDEAGQLEQLRQRGWLVDITRYGEGGGQRMPSRLTAENSDTRVKLVIDHWIFFD